MEQQPLPPQADAIPIMPPESIGLVMPTIVVPQLPPLGSLAIVVAPGTSRDPGSYPLHDAVPLQAPGSGRDPGRTRSPLRSARADGDRRIDDSLPFMDLTAELSLIIDGSNRRATEEAVESRERAFPITTVSRLPRCVQS